MDKRVHSPYDNNKSFGKTQILLRVLTIGTTLAAAVVMFTAKQTVVVYGIEADARYSYSSAFKFFAIANIVACGVSLVTLLLAFVCGKTKGLNSSHLFYFFVHDLVITVLLISACAAATSIGYVGKYGNSHTGWIAICDHFGKFCNKITAAAVLSYLGFVFSLLLTISSAHKARHQ